MLIPKVSAAPVDYVKANCAGQGCADRETCRRFQVRIGESWEVTTGRWGSFDIERARFGGECPAFKRWIGERRAA